ncbi:MAG: hypothetical protein LBP59_17890 [Planctomycetaceae bacterium]|jgi:hypothetical protein|nr:hypothetical protein [Planctomycetaceae bacterium]
MKKLTRVVLGALLSAGVEDIPVDWMDQEIEVTMKPLGLPPKPTKDELKEMEKEVKKMKGCLKQYANPKLRKLEAKAWENAAAEKYKIKNKVTVQENFQR